MSPTKMTALRLDEGLLEAMKEFKNRQGVPMTVQIELAVTEWLEKKGMKVKTERKRAAARKRST